MQLAADAGPTFTEIARRAQIVDAAIDMLAEQTYAAASFAHIADRAGLDGPAVVGFYFDSRDELDAEVVAEVLRRISAS